MANNFIDPVDAYMEKLKARRSAPSSVQNDYVHSAFDTSDPNLVQPTNQIDYYTNQLAQSDVPVEKPGFWGSLLQSTPVKVLGKGLEILTSPLNALYSGFMHGVNNAVPHIGDALNNIGSGHIADGLGDIAKGVASAPVGFVEGAAGGLLSPYTDALRPHNQGLVDVLNTLKQQDNSALKYVGENAYKVSPTTYIAKLLGADDKSAQQWGEMGLDVGASVLADPYNAVSGAGKAVKAVQSGTKILEEANKVADISKALNAVRKSEGLSELYDAASKINTLDKTDEIKSILNGLKGAETNNYIKDVLGTTKNLDNADSLKTALNSKLLEYDNSFTNQADYIYRKAQKAMGAMPGYEGIKFGNKTLISAEQLAKLGDTKFKYPVMALGTFLNPAAGLYASATPIGKLLRKTEAGSAFADLFTGGKNNKLYKMIQENPETATDAALQMSLKDKRYGQMLINKQERMKQTADLSQGITPDEANKITYATETPYTKVVKENTRTIDVLNPEYMLQAKYWNTGQIREANARMAKLEEDIQNASAKLNTGDIKSVAELADMKRQQIALHNLIEESTTNLYKRSYDYNVVLKDMKFFDDSAVNRLPYELLANPNEVSSRTTKELAQIIKQYTKASDKEALRKARTMKGASDVVMNTIEKTMPGYSKYFVGYNKASVADMLGDKEFRPMQFTSKYQDEWNKAYDAKKAITDKLKTATGEDKVKLENEYKVLEKKVQDINSKMALERADAYKNSKSEPSKLKVDNTVETVKTTPQRSMEDAYKKTQKNYDSSGLISKEQRAKIDELHSKLNFHALSKEQTNVLNGLDSTSATTYIHNLEAQFNKRARLNAIGQVVSKKTGKKISSAEEIDRLSALTHTMPRISPIDEHTPEAMRVLEIGRLERIAKHTAKPVLSDSQYSKLSDLLANTFGKEEAYKYVSEEGDNLTRDLKQLSSDELATIIEGIHNRRNNPFLFKLAIGDTKNSDAELKHIKDTMNLSDIVKSLDHNTSSYKKLMHDIDNSLANGVVKEDAVNSVSDVISEDAKTANNLMEQLNSNQFKNADELLKDQPDSVLDQILFKQENELNTGSVSHGRSSDFDSLSTQEKIDRIKENYTQGMEMRKTQPATDKQIEALRNAVHNSYNYKNKYYNEIATILGDTKGVEVKLGGKVNSLGLINGDVTREQVNSIFNLVRLGDRLDKLKTLNEPAYNELLKSKILDAVNYKAIKAGDKETALKAVDDATAYIEKNISEEALKTVQLSKVQSARLRENIINSAKYLYTIGAKNKSKEWMDYANGIQQKMKSIVFENPAQYIAFNNRIQHLVEAATLNELKPQEVRKLITDMPFTSSDLGKEIKVMRFETPNGVINVDVNTPFGSASVTQHAFENSSIDNILSNIETTVTPSINNAGLYGGNIVINSKNSVDALFHEAAHAGFDSKPGIGAKVSNDVSKTLKDALDVHYSNISNQLHNAGISVSEDALKHGYISDYVYNLSKEKGITKTDINHEQFAEFTRAVLKGGSSVKSLFDKSIIDDWQRVLSETPKKYIDTLLPKHISLKDEYVQQFNKIKDVIDLYGSDKISDYVDLQNQVAEIQNRYGDTQKLLTAFEANVKNTGIPKFKKVEEDLEPIITQIDNRTNLSEIGQRVSKLIAEDFKHMKIEEGVLTPEDIQNTAAYFTHMLNPKLKDSEVLKKLTKSGILDEGDLSDPYNIFTRNRKLHGTIEKINKYMYDKHGIEQFFETNALKIHLMRGLKHEDIMYRKQMLDDTLNLFAHKVVPMKELQKMSLDDLGRLSKKLGFQPKMADIPDHFDRTTKYVEGASQKTDTVIPYTISKAAESQQKLMYINGYRDWLDNKLGNNYVRVAYNKQYIKTPVRTLDEAALETANQTKRDMNNITEAVQAAADDTRSQMLQMNLEQPLITINPSDLHTENYYKMESDGVFIMPKRALEDYQETMQKAFKDDKNALLGLYDKFLGTWKSMAVMSPSFHANNAIGNIFNSYTQIGSNMLNPKKMWQVMRMQAGKKGSIAGHSFEEILKEASKRDLLDNFFTVDFGDANKYINSEAQTLLENNSKSKLKRLIGNPKESFNPLNPKFLLYRANQKIGSTIEQNARLMNFITHLENGKTFDEAADLTNKVMFDYTDLTPFELNVMKRAFPFYTFIRKNVPLQIEKMTEKPGIYGKLYNMYNSASKTNETNRDRALKPDSFMSRLPLPGGKYLNLSLPALDINKVTDFKELYNMQNPLTKLATEYVTGKNVYTGGNIDNMPLHALETLAPKAKGMSVNPLNIADLNMPLQERTALYNYLAKIQKDYYDAKNNGIIKADNGSEESAALKNVQAGKKVDPLDLYMSKIKAERAKAAKDAALKKKAQSERTIY